MQMICHFMYGTSAFTDFGIRSGSWNQYPHGYRGTKKHYEDNQFFYETILSTRGQCLYAIPLPQSYRFPPFPELFQSEPITLSPSVRLFHTFRSFWPHSAFYPECGYLKDFLIF